MDKAARLLLFEHCWRNVAALGDEEDRAALSQLPIWPTCLGTQITLHASLLGTCSEAALTSVLGSIAELPESMQACGFHSYPPSLLYW